MTFATPSAPGSDFPITQHDCESAGERPRPAQQQVGEGRVSSVTDEERERLIRRAGRMMRLSMARWERYGCFGDRGMADYWRLTMESDIKARSPAQVARMEAQRGLA